MKLSKYHLTTDLLDEYGFVDKLIVFSTRTAASLLIDANTYVDLEESNFENIDEDSLSLFKKYQLVVDKNEDEFLTIVTDNETSKNEVNVLSMTIQPSANCQLGCHYCAQVHTKDYAKEDVIEKYIERILYFLNKDDKYTGVNIIWYGGEPLTGLTSIKKTSERIMKICAERNLHYSASMVTNGLSLKDNVFQDLVTNYHILDYQITLDGLAETHDKRRYTKEGHPTFDLIFQNIIACTKTEAYQSKKGAISVRINIDQTNYMFVEPLLEYIVERGINEYIRVSFAPIVDWGGNDAGKASLTKQDFAAKEIEWLMKCYDNKIGFINLLPKRTYYACMVERQDSEVFDAFGNVYTCWEFPYTDTYAKDKHKIGNLFNEFDTFDTNATLRNWSDVVKSGDTWCKECVHLPVCAGGCPKSWYEGTPACPEFKFNYKEKLLLDYYTKNNSSQVLEPV
jgi:uncharacterized protein